VQCFGLNADCLICSSLPWPVVLPVRLVVSGFIRLSSPRLDFPLSHRSGKSPFHLESNYQSDQPISATDLACQSDPRWLWRRSTSRVDPACQSSLIIFCGLGLREQFPQQSHSKDCPHRHRQKPNHVTEIVDHDAQNACTDGG
jgi:hypothetical protein